MKREQIRQSISSYAQVANATYQNIFPSILLARNCCTNSFGYLGFIANFIASFYCEFCLPPIKQVRAVERKEILNQSIIYPAIIVKPSLLPCYIR
jgi:hypothetical protein